MFLGMTLWFSATAATAPIVAEFGLTPGETAWLTMAVQGGFVLGTLGSALLHRESTLPVLRMLSPPLLFIYVLPMVVAAFLGTRHVDEIPG